MSPLSADSIIAIPALLIASLGVGLTYLTLRRQNVSRNDIETSAIELIATHTSATPPRYDINMRFWLTRSKFYVNLVLNYSHHLKRQHSPYHQAETLLNCNSHR